MEQDMMDTYNAFAPSQSEVDSFKEKLENSKAEQKNLFLIIFQVGNRFFPVLHFYAIFSVLLQLFLITLKSMENWMKKHIMENENWIKTKLGW